MLTSKQPQPDLASPSPTPGSGSPITPASATATTRPGNAVERRTAWLGSSIQVEGKISSNEDLQIDGTVEGPISLQGKKLTVGRTAQLKSEILAREVIVYGKVHGNLRALDRVVLMKDGSVIGDITTSRIMIEDGAHFKGKIEIDRSKRASDTDLESVGAPAATGAR
jgi:cytoskeletal protein CcmA (bactofilin family)